MVGKSFFMLVELAEVENIPLKKSQCFQFLFWNTFSVWNSKMVWNQQHMFQAWIKFILTYLFYLKNEDFWLLLTFPLASKWTERWLLLLLLCAVHAMGLFVSLPWQPTSLGAWGIPGWDYHTFSVKRRAPVLSSQPHKSYFLSYLAPIARVSEGILDFWRISSRSLFTKQGWSHFASMRGAQAPCLSFLGSSVSHASAKTIGFILSVSPAQGIAWLCVTVTMCSAPSPCAGSHCLGLGSQSLWGRD